MREDFFCRFFEADELFQGRANRIHRVNLVLRFFAGELSRLNPLGINVAPQSKLPLGAFELKGESHLHSRSKRNLACSQIVSKSLFCVEFASSQKCRHPSGADPRRSGETLESNGLMMKRVNTAQPPILGRSCRLRSHNSILAVSVSSHGLNSKTVDSNQFPCGIVIQKSGTHFPTANWPGS